jgi:hypothetical protein
MNLLSQTEWMIEGTVKQLKENRFDRHAVAVSLRLSPATLSEPSGVGDGEAFSERKNAPSH